MPQRAGAWQVLTLTVTSLSALFGMFLETVMWAPDISWMLLILAPLRPITRPTRALDTVICTVLWQREIGRAHV